MPTTPVVGRVLAVQAIDGADQVRLARIDNGHRTLRIVFGGYLSVVEVGALVPVASPGCRVPRRGNAAHVKIRPRRYRDTLSEGMLCSLVELGWVDAGPDEVAVFRKGRAGQVLPLEGELKEWLSDNAYRRHLEYFMPLGNLKLSVSPPLEPGLPPTKPLLLSDIAEATRPARSRPREQLVS
jgi:tRNA-binding EMAP/Myf-like protein